MSRLRRPFVNGVTRDFLTHPERMLRILMEP